MKNKLSRRTLLHRAGISASAVAVGVLPTSARASHLITRAEVASMVGPLLILGLPAKSPDDDSAQILARQIQQGKVGGSILLRHNIQDRDSVLALTNLFMRADPQVLNAVDQEGGLVQRLSKELGFTRLPRARWVATNFSRQQARELYFEAGEEMRRAGFNLNLAPSVDWHDPQNPVIGKHGRSFGSHQEIIERYATSFIEGMQRAGLAATLKHFPGHGTSQGDSHNGFVDITSTWTEKELEPFRRLAAQAPLVMGGHLFHPRFSDGELPITFSTRALQSELRDHLGFSGAIITDDLDMGAIRKTYSVEDAVVRSLQAGNDLLLMSNSLKYDPDLPDKTVDWVLSAIKDHRLDIARLRDAHQRVVRLKQRFAFVLPTFG